MRPTNARKFMIAALSAAAIVAGSVVPAYAAGEPTEGAAADNGAVAAEETPVADGAAEEGPAADGAAAEDPADEGDDSDAPAASWKQDSVGWWFDLGDGTYAMNEQVEIDDKIYRFDSRGYMVTGWYNQEGSWEYYGTSGDQAFGWHLIGGTWYFMDPDLGTMQTGWLEIDGSWYYMNDSGAMVTGWNAIHGSWYYMNDSGAMVTGWNMIRGSWYYMNDSGAMLDGWVKDGEHWYYMDASGAMVTGTRWINGERHWFYGNGVWWGLYQ